MQKDDRHAIEVAEKAGRLEATMLARAKLHYDRHLHRMKILMTGFNISTMIVIAIVCFALILTVVWPALSIMGGTKNAMQSLGLSSEGAGLGQEMPAASEGARGKKTPSLTPEELRTKLFNKKYGRKIAEFIKEYGAAPGKAQDGGWQADKSSPKRLSPRSPTGKTQFNKVERTSIQPTEIKSR